ncbi:MAG: HEPN domain-containing protein [Nitrospirota bacterium]
MNFKDFKERGLIEENPPNFKQISNLQARAFKDLITAETILETDPEWAYTIAYQATMRAAKALILSEGYRPKGREQQRTIVQLTAVILGKGLKTLAVKFDRIGRKGQWFIEDPDKPISKYEVEEAMKDAKEFVEKVIDIARERNPQLSLL